MEGIHSIGVLGAQQDQQMEWRKQRTLMKVELLVLVKCFISLAQATVIWDEETSLEKMPPSVCSVAKAVGHFLP